VPDVSFSEQGSVEATHDLVSLDRDAPIGSGAEARRLDPRVDLRPLARPAVTHGLLSADPPGLLSADPPGLLSADPPAFPGVGPIDVLNHLCENLVDVAGVEGRMGEAEPSFAVHGSHHLGSATGTSDSTRALREHGVHEHRPQPGEDR
jgi:hypothetical protein